MSFYLFASGGTKTTGASNTFNDPETGTPWSSDGTWYDALEDIVWGYANCYDSDGHTNILDAIQDELGTTLGEGDIVVVDNGIYSFSGGMYTTTSWDNSKTQDFVIASRDTNTTLCQWVGASNMDARMIRLRRVDAGVDDEFLFKITFQGIGFSHANQSIGANQDGFIFQIDKNVNLVGFTDCKIDASMTHAGQAYPVKITTDDDKGAGNYFELALDNTVFTGTLTCGDAPRLVEDAQDNVRVTGSLRVENLTLSATAISQNFDPMIRAEKGCNLTSVNLENITVNVDDNTVWRAAGVVGKSLNGDATLSYTVKNITADNVVYNCGLSGLFQCTIGSYLIEDYTATNCKTNLGTDGFGGQGLLFECGGQAGREDLGDTGIVRRVNAYRCRAKFGMLYATFSASMRIEGLITEECEGDTGTGAYKGGSGDMYLSGYTSINDKAGRHAVFYSHHTGGSGGRDTRTATTKISGMTVKGFSIDTSLENLGSLTPVKSSERMIVINGSSNASNDHNAEVYNLSSDHDVEVDIRADQDVSALTLDLYNSTDNIVIEEDGSPTVTTTGSVTADGKMTPEGKLTAGSVLYAAGKLPTGLQNVDARGRNRPNPPSIGGYEPTHGDPSPVAKSVKGVGLYGTHFDSPNLQYMVNSSGFTGFVAGGLTIAFWIKMHSGNGTNYHIIDTTSARRFYIDRNTSNKIVVKAWNASSQVTLNIGSNATFTAGEAWKHVFLTFDESTYTYYVNGALDKTGSLTNGAIGIELNGQFAIGNNPAGGIASLPGAISDMWMVDQYLDPATYISKFYDGGYVDLGSDGSNVGVTPKAFYPKSPWYAQVVEDASGANDMVWTGQLPVGAVGPGV